MIGAMWVTARLIARMKKSILANPMSFPEYSFGSRYRAMDSIIQIQAAIANSSIYMNSCLCIAYTRMKILKKTAKGL
jgi:hypothetical protein